MCRGVITSNVHCNIFQHKSDESSSQGPYTPSNPTQSDLRFKGGGLLPHCPISSSDHVSTVVIAVSFSMAPFLSKFQKTGLALTTLSLLQNSPQKREFWSKKWLRERKKFTHSLVLKELDSNDFRNFLRMNEQCFSELLIEKQNTVLRESVSAEYRLIVTLRFLATGRKCADMKFSAAFSPLVSAFSVRILCITGVPQTPVIFITL